MTASPMTAWTQAQQRENPPRAGLGIGDRKAVREADVVVVCLPKQFNQAGFQQKEVHLALDTAMEKPEGEIFIIPARLEEYETLESLRKWHWVDLFENECYERLMRALRARADRIGKNYPYTFTNRNNGRHRRVNGTCISWRVYDGH